MQPRAQIVRARREPAPVLPRPVDYTEALAQDICSRLANGASLGGITRMPAMPELETVADWIFDDVEGFRARYERARMTRAMIWEEELLQIADDPDADIKEAARKLRIDVRKWLLSKWLPKQFGDKLGLASEEDSPMNVTIVRYGDDPIAE